MGLVEDAVSDAVPLLGLKTGVEVGVVLGIVVVVVADRDVDEVLVSEDALSEGVDAAELVSDDVKVVPTDEVLVPEDTLSEGVDVAEPDGASVWDESTVDTSKSKVCDVLSRDIEMAAEVTLVCDDEVISTNEELVSEYDKVVTAETVTLDDGGGDIDPLSLEDESEVKDVLVAVGVWSRLEEVSVACDEFEPVE